MIDKPMTERQIARGVEIAQLAALFAIFVYGKSKAGDVRDAIETLFGLDVAKRVEAAAKEKARTGL